VVAVGRLVIEDIFAAKEGRYHCKNVIAPA
jgi:hypothetical protein